MKNGLQSAYINTQKTWNEANKKSRQAMLTAAGHPNADYGRAFAFLPQYVRNNLIYQSTRKIAAKAPDSSKPKTIKPHKAPSGDFWWHKI
jgi:hypothetical protein